MVDPKKLRQRMNLAKQGPAALAMAQMMDHVNSLKGDQGIQGVPGETIVGPRGPVGPQGTPGRDGKPGRDGFRGPEGERGPEGKIGPLGKQGERGLMGEDGSPDTAEQVRDKLQKLKGDNRLDASAIKNLPEIISRLPEIQFYGGGGSPVKSVVAGDNITVTKTDSGTYIISSTGGGSTTNFADNETPSGTIDGINTVFTLAHSPDPAASLILVLNGLTQTQGVEYTLSGSTITFAVAPDAELSGLPFKSWYRYV